VQGKVSTYPTLPIGHRCLTRDLVPVDIKLFSEAGGDASVSKSELAKIPGFEVADAGVKGLGAVALQEFHRGDLVIAEAPLFSIIQREDNERFNREAAEAAINALSPEKRKEYESLHNTHSNRVARNWGIFSTNVFQMTDDTCGIFLQCSRFNHSCSPNARYSWNPQAKRLRIYALRDIARGDEILVTYLGGRNVYGSTRAERRVRLQLRGFTCYCDVCTQPDTVASDERRIRVKELWESIPYFLPNQGRQRLLAIARGIKLLKEEGYAADYDDFTNDAAWVCAYHSDWASTKYWAAKTYNTRVAEFGEDSDRAKEVKGVFEDPKTSKLAGMGPRQTFNVRL
jgi:hypothetical protein